MTPTSATRGEPLNTCAPPLRESKRRAAGFTLLELIIVLAILAMGAVLLIPSIGNMSARTFTAQVREVGALLNYARRNAVVTGQATSAQFFPDPQRDDAPQPTVPSGLGRSQDWRARGIDLAYEDSTQQRAAVDDGVTITFFPEGGSTGGALILTLDRREAVISIDPFSGKVRTEYSDD